MIKVSVENWHYKNKFKTKIYEIDDTKRIKLVVGEDIFATQISDFEIVYDDWNNDNDEYELFGAYFQIGYGTSFLTPETIVHYITEENATIIYE